MAITEYRLKSITDLKEIWAYIAQDNSQRADEWLNTLRKTIEMLSDQPYMGTSRPEYEHDIHGFPIGKYLILYQIIQNGICVVRVLHGARLLKRAWDA
ncbi:MAG: type II toxin-antitoxin system RelE/ParE family toxin [Magnetococcus sp. YQC-5]